MFWKKQKRELSGVDSGEGRCTTVDVWQAATAQPHHARRAGTRQTANAAIRRTFRKQIYCLKFKDVMSIVFEPIRGCRVAFVVGVEGGGGNGTNEPAHSPREVQVDPDRTHANWSAKQRQKEYIVMLVIKFVCSLH
jgi:hypothetical protein